MLELDLTKFCLFLGGCYTATGRFGHMLEEWFSSSKCSNRHTVWHVRSPNIALRKCPHSVAFFSFKHPNLIPSKLLTLPDTDWPRRKSVKGLGMSWLDGWSQGPMATVMGTPWKKWPISWGVAHQLANFGIETGQNFGYPSFFGQTHCKRHSSRPPDPRCLRILVGDCDAVAINLRDDQISNLLWRVLVHRFACELRNVKLWSPKKAVEWTCRSFQPRHVHPGFIDCPSRLNFQPIPLLASTSEVPDLWEYLICY